MEPLVSVSVVTYNHRKYIAECLDSILSQERDFPIEILIHDDASTDGAQEIIREYQNRYDFIKPILREENQYQKGIRNISGAFNFPRARGKYLALLDGDDYWTDKNKLKKQTDFLEHHKDFVFCFHSARIVSDGLSDPDLLKPFSKSGEISPEELIGRKKGIPFGSFFLRREILTELPEYYWKCPVGDRPLEMLAASKGRSYYFDERMSVYRFNIFGSWTASQMDNEKMEERQRAFQKEMKECFSLFDKETGGRFHKELEKAERRNDFLVEVNLRNYKRIFTRDNKEFFRELSLKDRMFIYFQYACPSVYSLLRDIRKR